MVVAVQRTALSGMHRFLNVCVVEYSPLPCAMTIHNARSDQQWNGDQNSASVQDQRSMCWQYTNHGKHLDLSRFADPANNHTPRFTLLMLASNNIHTDWEVD